MPNRVRSQLFRVEGSPASAVTADGILTQDVQPYHDSANLTIYAFPFIHPSPPPPIDNHLLFQRC